jgi:hypothetical protein
MTFSAIHRDFLRVGFVPVVKCLGVFIGMRGVGPQVLEGNLLHDRFRRCRAGGTGRTRFRRRTGNGRRWGRICWGWGFSRPGAGSQEQDKGYEQDASQYIFHFHSEFTSLSYDYDVITGKINLVLSFQGIDCIVLRRDIVISWISAHLLVSIHPGTVKIPFI